MDPNQIIDAFGGATGLAKLCRISPQAVTQWRRKGIPPARRQFLELLRPELFNGHLLPAAQDEQKAA